MSAVFNIVATALKTACRSPKTVLNLCEINEFSPMLSQTPLSALRRHKSLLRRFSPPSAA